MDILGLGDLALDLFTGLGLAKPDRAAGPGAKAAPEQEREPSPRLGALVVVGVASLAILAVAVSFLFSEAGRDFFASMGGTGNLGVGERLMHVLGGLDLLGWLVLAAFLLPEHNGFPQRHTEFDHRAASHPQHHHALLARCQRQRKQGSAALHLALRRGVHRAGELRRLPA